MPTWPEPTCRAAPSQVTASARCEGPFTAPARALTRPRPAALLRRPARCRSCAEAPPWCGARREAVGRVAGDGRRRGRNRPAQDQRVRPDAELRGLGHGRRRRPSAACLAAPQAICVGRRCLGSPPPRAGGPAGAGRPDAVGGCAVGQRWRAVWVGVGGRG